MTEIQDMKIAIACRDQKLSKLLYELLPQIAPQDVVGSFESLDALIRANDMGSVDVVILDQGFHERAIDLARPKGALGTLRVVSVPVVALMPRAPSFASPASKGFETIAIMTGAVQLDLPTTAEGMRVAILRAIDNRERAGPPRGADYGKAASERSEVLSGGVSATGGLSPAVPDAWAKAPPAGLPAEIEALEQAQEDADEVTEAFREPPSLIEDPPGPDVPAESGQDDDERYDFGQITPAQKAIWVKETRERGLKAIAEEKELRAVFAREAQRLLDDGTLDLTLDLDPMDALIEAAKAVVLETRGQIKPRTTGTGYAPPAFSIDSAALVALYQALEDAGYPAW